MRRHSLKTTMALTMSVLFVVFVVITAAITLVCMERELKASIGRQQLAMARSLADSVDDKLILTSAAIKAGAGSVSTATLSTPEMAHRFLSGKTTLISLFNQGILIADVNGRILAANSISTGIRTPPATLLGHFRKPLASPEVQISRPFVDGDTGDQPLIMVTAPITGPDGKVSAVLIGVINLLRNNLLDDLFRLRIGRSGYIYIYDSSRTLISHPDRSRIMKRDVPPGANRLFDLALTGFEGSGETVNSRGVPLLASFAHLKSTDWILAVNYPVAEAYVSLNNLKWSFILVTVLMTFGVLVTTWFLMKRLTGPLSAITAHVESLAEKGEGDKSIRIASRDEIGTLAGAFNGMLADLAMQQRALRESESNFRSIAENANDGILIADETGLILYANRRGEELSGHGEPLYGMKIGDLFICEDHPRAPMSLNGMVDGESSPPQYESTLRCADGRRTAVEVTSAVTGWQGAPAALLIFRDITERKLREEERQQLNTELEKRVGERTRQLEEANHELEAFNYSLSHDLRTPLNLICGYSEQLLAECTGLHADYRVYLEKILAGGERMESLIRAMLDLSRASRGTLVPEELDLSELLRVVAAELMISIPDRAVEMLVAPGMTVYGDPVLLRSLVENLLSNALKYSADREKTIVEAGCIGQGNDVVYYVRDNGAGFDMACAERLFLPFQRLHDRNRYPGHGIGLATVRRIVDRHGGAIRAEGAVGLGATIYFTLPAKPSVAVSGETGVFKEP